MHHSIEQNYGKVHSFIFASNLLLYQLIFFPPQHVLNHISFTLLNKAMR